MWEEQVVCTLIWIGTSVKYEQVLTAQCQHSAAVFSLSCLDDLRLDMGNGFYVSAAGLQENDGRDETITTLSAGLALPLSGVWLRMASHGEQPSKATKREP